MLNCTRRVTQPLTSLIVQRKRTFCARFGAEYEHVSIVVVMEEDPDAFSYGYSGGVARPYSSLPQQATEPSLLTPQVWLDPALTETKEPAGGVAWPSSIAAPAGDGAVAPHPAGVEPTRR